MSDTLTRPTRTTLPDLEQGSPEWHDQRRGIVTASVIGNLITTRKLAAKDYECPDCGAAKEAPCVGKRPPHAPVKTMHPERADVARRSTSGTVFETASNDVSRGLTMLLVAERITGWTEEMHMNDDMWRGVFDEPRARDKYSECYAPVTQVGFMTYEEPGLKLGFSPDGLVGDEGLIEIKSRRPKKQVSTIISGHPPVETMAQIQCGLLVSGRKWLDYISYAGGLPMWVHRVYPDHRWFDAIIAAGRAFESNAAEMIRLFTEGAEGFPMTERIVEQELVI
ncbi:hypothetical protein CH249_25855 [Rhodococcus sp. 05-2255-3B1]|uniref:YqaJ viral recombinase family protein n=1 Tax=Rhodococcus sp. 05-2255-3B1 TaxID=2022482 RepID=UPI000B9BAC9C|nr:YqaJ viral recombinase family protein [Rhodococcus sp. 05-2255-3B1]OZE04361.1 hypothetical protein CH249_25855 [Rhodococcus sp. 05-2255-3B1]